MTPANFISYEPGTVLGNWTVVRRQGEDVRGTCKWLVTHTCGAERAIRGTELRSGRIGRCRCEHPPRATRKRAKRSDHPLLSVWHNMVRRCHCETNKDYARYSGRGIVVCDAWRSPGGFRRFVTDMGDRPSPKHSIDRIDSAGPYSPENCRWATMKEQQRNRSNNRRHDFNGESLTLPEVGERCGIPWRIIKGRIVRGWSLADAASTPQSPRKRAAT